MHGTRMILRASLAPVEWQWHISVFSSFKNQRMYYPKNHNPVHCIQSQDNFSTQLIEVVKYEKSTPDRQILTVDTCPSVSQLHVLTIDRKIWSSAAGGELSRQTPVSPSTTCRPATASTLPSTFTPTLICSTLKPMSGWMDLWMLACQEHRSNHWL